MRLNIAYSTDENYVRHLGVSMISLFENNKDFSEIVVYIIENNVSSMSKQILLDISEKYERNLQIISFESLVKKLRVDDSFSLSSYARLFLGNIGDIDKIVYLDCDSIVQNSFQELWVTDITDFYVGGVQDTVNKFYLTSIDLNKNNRYINAGFLIINLKKWREDKLEEKFIEFIEKYNGSVPHHDQGTINGVCKNKILILDPKYNLQCPMFHFTSKQIKSLDDIDIYYSQKQLDDAKVNPVFIHFTNGYFNRPWNKKCIHPLRNEYLNYLSMSPWKDQILDGDLSRNSKIMKFIYTYFHFIFYKMICVMISKRKTKKMLRVYM